MKQLLKPALFFICVILAISFVAGCKNVNNDTEPTQSPEATEAPGEDIYAPLTTAYVAKVGGEPIYESEFYYFLYQGVRNIYSQAEDIFDENATDEENLAKMIEYFNSEAEDGVTYMQKAVDYTLETAKGFKIAYLLGKKASDEDSAYTISRETIDEMLEYIESEAAYGSYSYGMTPDEYFLYCYGMNVNDAKRYSEEQMFAELYETVWADKNGWSIGMEKPEEPTKPTEPAKPAENATDEEKKAYQESLKTYEEAMTEYNEKLAQYEQDLARYNELRAVYLDKFRDFYAENKNDFDIETIRYMYLSKGDDENAAKAKAEKYIKYFNDGEDFAALVKGFSESETVAADEGLVDIDLYGAELNFNVAADVVEWANAQSELSKEIKTIETEDAIYLVMVVGITDFDKTTGIVFDEENTTNETVRANVEYSRLAGLFNAHIDGLFDSEDYKTTEANNDRMLELARKYLTYTE